MDAQVTENDVIKELIDKTLSKSIKWCIHGGYWETTFEDGKCRCLLFFTGTLRLFADENVNPQYETIDRSQTPELVGAVNKLLPNDTISRDKKLALFVECLKRQEPLTL